MFVLKTAKQISIFFFGKKWRKKVCLIESHFFIQSNGKFSNHKTPPFLTAKPTTKLRIEFVILERSITPFFPFFSLSSRFNIHHFGMLVICGFVRFYLICTFTWMEEENFLIFDGNQVNKSKGTTPFKVNCLTIDKLLFYFVIT